MVKEICRVWSFPTKFGGVDYHLVETDEGKKIRVVGTDNGMNEINELQEVDFFLMCVRERPDYKYIANCVEKQKNNTRC